MGINCLKYAKLVLNFFTCFILLSWIQFPAERGLVLALPQPNPNLNQDWPSNLNFGAESKTSDKYDNWENNWPFGSHQNNHIHFSTKEEDEHRNIAEMATKTIAAIVIFLVLASFIAFLICLCCPICILAKMRQRRRGFVYQTAATNPNGATTVTNDRTSVTVLQSGPPNLSQQGIQVITTNTSQAPYPVQPSVTVIPHQQQQHQMSSPYGHGQNPNAIPYPVPNQTAPAPAPYPIGPNTGMPMPVPMSMMGHNQNFPNHPTSHQGPPQDLPPPYPGLPREVDSASQPAYNPYFNDNGDAPSPYMPTTAPYPTKH